MSANQPHAHSPRIDRRDVLLSALAAGGVALAASEKASAAPAVQPDSRRASPRRYDMKKSINLWAFPYPQRMTLRECLQLAKDAGFDGIELNYDLENDLSPKSGAKEYQAIRKMAAEIGTENLLVVPGAVGIPWIKDHDPVAADVCDRRAREAIAKLVPKAEKLGVYLNIENIFFNGYLLSPQDMNAFVDSFHSKHVRVHFDTGNIMLFQFPEHWIPILGPRIKNIHLKEFTKKGTDHSLESFRPLLDGTTNWPAVTEALDKIGYRDYLTFEYFHPFPHYPEALIHQTSDALDRILGRKQ